VNPIARSRRAHAHLVTEAQPSLSADVAARQRRYLIMMGIRVACFGVTIVLFVAGAGWLAAIPAAGAILIPYFAVVMANGGREPADTKRFKPYEPRLPERWTPPADGWPPAGGSGPGGPSPAAPRPGGYIRESEPERQPKNG
jgi:Protein of unknown function (DUF3099)